jgi:hypothetical protein
MLTHNSQSIPLVVHNHRTFIFIPVSLIHFGRYIMDFRNPRHRTDTPARLSVNYICELKLDKDNKYK